MLHRSPKFLEITGSDFLPIFLVAKHNRIIVVEDDPRIVPPQKMEIERAESGGSEKNDKIMAASLPNQMQTFANAGATGAQGRDLNTGRSIMFETVPQPQPSARSAAGFDDAEDLHSMAIL